MSEVTIRMQQALSRLPRTDTVPFSSYLNPEYTRRHIALSLTPATLLFALHRAREAQNLAVSYRNFRVGAAITGLAFRPSRFEIMTGINVKPDEGSAMNVHAEQVALQKVHDRRYDTVGIVAVVGETQADQQSGHAMHTLHPCGLCRNVMQADALVDNEATLLVSALPTLRTIELYSLNALRRLHESQDDSGITRFELPALRLLEPLPATPPETSVEAAWHESPDELAEERIWDSTIGAYLTQRRQELLAHDA